MTDFFHQSAKGPPKRSGWENQKETTDDYRENWDRIFKKKGNKCVGNVAVKKKLLDQK